MRFARFMARPAGRLGRIVAGGALIAVGALVGGAGWVVVAVGAVVAAAGGANVCLLGPLVHAPVRGARS